MGSKALTLTPKCLISSVSNEMLSPMPNEWIVLVRQRPTGPHVQFARGSPRATEIGCHIFEIE